MVQYRLLARLWMKLQNKVTDYAGKFIVLTDH